MKSYANGLLRLAEHIYRDATAKCSDAAFDYRDLETIRSRVGDEGLSFLTITLPTFGKDFDLSLAAGMIDSTVFRSFKKTGSIPSFLKGMINRVFDSEGRLYAEPCLSSVEAVRQIAYFFKKIKIPCTTKRVQKALDKFSADERIFENQLAPTDVEKFINVSRVLWNHVFNNRDSLLFTCIPKHGPGATAERLSGNAKFLMQRWHDRLEPYFPLLDTAFVNSNAVESEEFEKMEIVSEDDEQPVRVVPVPKTLKGPRIIAIEPVCMQYTQQALSRELYKILESSDLVGGQVNFTDQSINQKLAITSSITKAYATIDMSSASDRVPCELALRMFDGVPDIRDAIYACRSKNAILPDGTLVPLKKFASMGSALCFPVEAMYFYTCCVRALLEARGLPCTFLAIRSVAKDVFVYGDDIIVPTDESDVVISTLQKYYCKVNVRKSFTTGNFRESCGMDAFLGEDVTPIYLRSVPPDNKRSASEIISWIATSNLLFAKGYWQTASLLVKEVERVIGFALPILGKCSGGLGLHHPFSDLVSVQRWNKDYQRLEVKTLVPVAVEQRDELDGWQALLKSLLLLETSDESLTRKDHLKRTARHGAVALKPRWIYPV